MPHADALETLGLKHGATRAEAASAFRKLSLLHHPDRHGADSETFLRIQLAKETLTKGACSGSADGSAPVCNPEGFTSGIRAGKDVGQTTAAGQYYSPVLDELFGPDAYRRCADFEKKGGTRKCCSCDLCSQADLYELFLAKPSPESKNPSASDDCVLEEDVEGGHDGSWRGNSPDYGRHGRSGSTGDLRGISRGRTSHCRRGRGRGGLTPDGEFRRQYRKQGVFFGDLLPRNMPKWLQRGSGRLNYRPRDRSAEGDNYRGGSRGGQQYGDHGEFNDTYMRVAYSRNGSGTGLDEIGSHAQDQRPRAPQFLHSPDVQRRRQQGPRGFQAPGRHGNTSNRYPPGRPHRRNDSDSSSPVTVQPSEGNLSTQYHDNRCRDQEARRTGGMWDRVNAPVFVPGNLACER